MTFLNLKVKPYYSSYSAQVMPPAPQKPGTHASAPETCLILTDMIGVQGHKHIKTTLLRQRHTNRLLIRTH